MSQRFTIDRSSFEQVLCATSLIQQLNRQVRNGHVPDQDAPQPLSDLVEAQLAIETETIDLEAAMNRVVGLAVKLSRATGAATWLFSGHEFVYRAGTGSGANDERLQLDTLSELASICGPSNHSIHDPHESNHWSPEYDAIHYPGSVKSLLVAPIYHGRSVAGALAVFSVEFNAFTECDATNARLLSGLLTHALGRLRLMRIEKYGAGGEKLSQAQMQLFELEPVESEMIEQAESEHTPVHRSTKKSVKHPGRQEFPANLPRVERILPCTQDQRVCKRCGKETVVIGYEESSQLDVEPAKYFVLLTKREKRACRSCEDLVVVSAPLPPRIIEKCLASDRIVIDTIVSKYCNHTLLHRQSRILERDTGLEISRATLDGWVLKVGELLIPMVAAMRRELVTGTYIQADETPVDVQMREGRGKNHQAYLWQYSRPGGSVVFDFRLGRGRDGPKRFLGQFEGILQTDGYAAYDQIGGPRMVHAACWAHARRQFFEAVQLNPRDPVATLIVARMDDLFAVDAEARRKALSVAARHVRRQETAKPLLDEIRSKIEAAQSVVLPSSVLSKACQYALTLWRKLTRFLEYPVLELSNNLAENSMRPVALGRKNWIHIGSPQAGPKVAAILSVVESCRRLKLPVRDYSPRFSPGLPISRSSASQTLLPLRGSPSIHRLKRSGC